MKKKKKKKKIRMEERTGAERGRKVERSGEETPVTKDPVESIATARGWARMVCVCVVCVWGGGGDTEGGRAGRGCHGSVPDGQPVSSPGDDGEDEGVSATSVCVWVCVYVCVCVCVRVCACAHACACV